jgi:hypothetical protein
MGRDSARRKRAIRAAALLAIALVPATFRPAISAPLLSAPFLSFDTGAAPRCVVVGDLNGDAIEDLVVANVNSNTVSVCSWAMGMGPLGRRQTTQLEALRTLWRWGT